MRPSRTSVRPGARVALRWSSPARGLHRVADEHETTPWTGDRALYEHDGALGIGLDDLEVEGRHLRCTEVTGHLRSLEHPRRGRARPDRSRCAVLFVVAVCGALTLEVVALHHPGKALAL